MVMNSQDFGALGGQQHLLVEVVQQRQVVGVYVHAVQDLPDCGHAAARWTLHLQLFALDHVVTWQVGGVYRRDEDLVVGVLLVLELELEVFQLTLEGLAVLLLLG
jgi:hypothetical protein